MKKNLFLGVALGICQCLFSQQTVPEWYFPNFSPAGGPVYFNHNFNGNATTFYEPATSPTTYISTSTLIKGANNKGLFALSNGILLDDVNWILDDLLDEEIGIQRMVYHELSQNQVQYRHAGVEGYTECIPLPVPIGNGKVDCNRYYIFAAGYGFSRSWKTFSNGDGIVFNNSSWEPYYSIVNMNTNNHNQYFETLQMKTTSSGHQLRCTALPLLDLPGYTGNGTEALEGCDFIAATKLRSDNTYFLFVLHRNQLIRFVVSATGITYGNIVYTEPNMSTIRFMPSEMEVVELGNGDYRIAFPYNSATTGNDMIKICEVFGSGANVGTLKSSPAPFDISVTQVGSARIVLHGLEFSPKGSYLYFTHETNSSNLNPIEYYNISTGVRSALSCAPSNKNDFALGFIERNSEPNTNCLYFTSQSELVKLTSPDLPGASTWNVIRNASSNYNNVLGSIKQYNDAYYTNTSYLLPDYADGFDYTQGFQTGTCCLDYKAIFDVKSGYTFPENNTYVITAGSTLPGSSIVVPANGILNINANITVPTGCKVTFQNLTLKFSPNASLIINSGATGQQGGKVAVYNSTLTAYTGCDPNTMWPGVVVNGYNNGVTPQGSTTNSQNGVLTTMGSSQIDHALCAIKMNGGAIVQFTNSRLYDNKVALEATAFVPTSTQVNDASLFQSVTFKTQSTFNILQPNYFVNIVGRDPKMRFLTCTFANEATTYNNSYDGIISTSSTLWVGSICTMSRLRYGVYFTNTNQASSRILTLGGTTFNNNSYGAYVGTSNYASISGNHFNILDNSTVCQWPNGLVLDASSKFKVSGNFFNNFSLAVATVSANGNWGGTTGLIAANTNLNDPSYVNIIEGNTFSNLNTGVSNAGANSTYTTTSPKNDRGLRYYCNSFQSNLSWFSMLFNTGIIDYHQGVADYGSQNQFNHSSGVNFYGVGQDANTKIGYIYQDDGTTAYIPTVDASQGLIVQLFPISNNSNDCSSTAVGSPGGRLSNDKTPSIYLNSISEIERNIKQLDNPKGNNSNEIAYLAGKRDQFQKELVLYYLNDSIPSSSDSVKKYMERFILESRNNRQLISFYLSNNNIAAAKKAFSDLQTEGISQNANAVYSTLIDYSNKDLRTELMADKDLFDKINTIANDKSDIEAYLLSRWMINMVDANTYREDISGVFPTRSETSTGLNDLKQNIYKLNNYPNPFNNTTTITVSIPEETKEASIKVTDVLGREISSYPLVNGNNILEFNEQNTKGLLFYTLYVNGRQVETKIMMKNN